MGRWEWGGDSEERGLQELLTIKDTWTKSKGRVEVGDGEKGHTTVIE